MRCCRTCRSLHRRTRTSALSSCWSSMRLSALNRDWCRPARPGTRAAICRSPCVWAIGVAAVLYFGLQTVSLAVLPQSRRDEPAPGGGERRAVRADRRADHAWWHGSLHGWQSRRCAVLIAAHHVRAWAGWPAAEHGLRLFRRGSVRPPCLSSCSAPQCLSWQPVARSCGWPDSASSVAFSSTSGVSRRCLSCAGATRTEPGVMRLAGRAAHSRRCGDDLPRVADTGESRGLPRYRRNAGCGLGVVLGGAPRGLVEGIGELRVG